jgi:regulator of sirC expression with transglutaminase-like and TPR domain
VVDNRTYRMMGKTREALRAYERYLELHPAGPSASIARNAIRSLKP